MQLEHSHILKVDKHQNMRAGKSHSNYICVLGFKDKAILRWC